MSGSSQKRVIDGVLFGYVQFVLDGAIRLLTIPIFLSALGPQLMGLRAAVLEIVGYLQVANPGTAEAMQAVVEKEVRNGKATAETQETLAAGRWVQTAIALLTFAITAWIAFHLDTLTEELAPEDARGAIWFTLAYGFVIALTLLGAHHSSLLAGLQEHRSHQLCFIVMHLSTAIGSVLLVWIGYRLGGLGLVAVAGTALFFILRRRFANRLGVSVPMPPLWPRLTLLKPVLKTSGWMLAATLGGAMVLQSFRMIASLLPEMGLVVANAVAILFVMPYLVLQLLNWIGYIVRPTLAAKYHAGELGDDLWPTVSTFLKLTACLAMITFVAGAVTNEAFVSLWVGDEYWAGADANLALCAMLAVRMVNAALQNLLYIRGNMRLRGQLCLVEGIGVLILSIAGGYYLGVFGIFAGATAFMLLVSLPIGFVLVCRQFELKRSALAVAVETSWYPTVLIAVYLIAQQVLAAPDSSWLALLGWCALIGMGLLVAVTPYLWKPMRPFTERYTRRFGF
ncbi:MAG: hypothetical protein AAF499_00485, partial [Pseudomonadota bacterium]